MTLNPYVDIQGHHDAYASDPTCSCFWSMIHILSRRDAWRTDRRICISSFYVLELGSWIEDPRDRRFLPPGGVLNRNLWGVENLRRSRSGNSKFAAQRFAHERRGRSRVSPIPRPSVHRRTRQRGSGSSLVATRTARAFCASAVSPKRRREDHRDLLTKNIASREHLRFCCRLRRLPAPDPSGHPPRLEGKPEAVGARRLRTSRAAIDCRAAHRLLGVPASSHRRFSADPQFATGGDRASRGRARRAARGSPSNANNVKSMIAKLDREPRSRIRQFHLQTIVAQPKLSIWTQCYARSQDERVTNARHRLALGGGLSTCEKYSRPRLRLGVSASR